MTQPHRDNNRDDRHEDDTPEDVLPPVEQVDFGPVLRVLDLLETPEERENRRRQEQAESDAAWQEFEAARARGENPIWELRGVPSVPGASVLILAAHGLVRSNFNWPRYAHAPRTQAIMAKLHAGDASTLGLDDARKILFCFARQSRFVEGSVGSAIDSGLIRLILERVQELTDENGTPRP